MGTVKILEETSKQPITLAGQMAGVAYGTDTTNQEKNYKRGLNCISSGHGKVLEYADVYMILEGYSIRTIREFARHQAGMPTFLQSSTRYINYNNFDYVIPPSIKKDKNALEIYKNCMFQISEYMKDLEACDIPREDVALLLPLGLETTISAKYNARTLIGMYEIRSCARAYHEYRQLMQDLKKALEEYSEEWKTLIDITFVTKCDKVGFCTEEYSCGKYCN